MIYIFGTTKYKHIVYYLVKMPPYCIST